MIVVKTVTTKLLITNTDHIFTARIRRMGEGNVFSLFTSGGGYPYPIMLCNISQNAMGQPGGGTLPGPAGGVPWLGGYPGRGGTLLGGYPAGGVPCWGGTLAGGVPPQGGTLARGGTLAGGYPGQGGTLAGGYPVRTT